MTLFQNARNRRRCNEHILTVAITNQPYYAPKYAREQDIWPPISGSHSAMQFERNAVFISSQSSNMMDSPPSAISAVDGALLRKLQTISTPDDILYHPLHEEKHIRVLDIHPGSFDDPVECSFHYADLRCLHIKYDALSYVWGKNEWHHYDSNTKRWVCERPSVRCNSQDIAVTPNLELALRHVRSRSAFRLLWVDALCINQQDHRERAHQVALMGSIYRSASSVILMAGNQELYEQPIWDERTSRLVSPPREFTNVRAQRAFGAVCDIVNLWLGTRSHEQRATYKTLSKSTGEWSTGSSFEEYPIEAEAFEDQRLMRLAMREYFLPRYAEGTFGMGNNGERNLPPPDLGISSTPESAPDSQFWMSLDDLFQNAWFWRVWVIQEAVLASSATVKWGNVEMDWRWLGLASAILRTNYQSICEAMQMGGVYNAYLMFRLSPMSNLPPLQLSFIQLLRLTRQFGVTDPRDRVYGLLGMQTDDNDPDREMLFLPPDYSLDEAELWKRLAWKLIHDSRSLMVLSSVQHTSNTDARRLYLDKTTSRSRSKSPSKSLSGSWVPNFDIIYRATLAAWDNDDAFAAAKGFPLEMKGSIDTPTDVLEVKSIEVATVCYEGAYMWHDVDTGLLTFENDLGNYFATEEGLRLLCRTYTAGRNSYGTLIETSDETLCDFAAYLLKMNEDAIIDGHVTDYEELDYRALENRGYVPRKARDYRHVFKAHEGLKERLESWAEHGQAARFRASAVGLCERRRLFLTMNGFIGLGPDHVEEGDVVAVLSGGDVPFLLRPILQNDEVDSLETLPRYYLVGECFVEGLMKGEAVIAAEQETTLMGPIPPDIARQHIKGCRNDAERIPAVGTISQTQKAKEGQAQLDARDLLTCEMPDCGKHVLRKTEIAIW